MILEVFDAEHGACSLVTTSNGRRIMIDCGHNATTGWRPGIFLRSAGVSRIDRLFVMNYDEDHVAGYPDLMANVAVDVLVELSVMPGTIRYLKSEDGMGNGIDMLTRTIEGLFIGGPPPAHDDFGDTSFSLYWNNYGIPPFRPDIVMGHSVGRSRRCASLEASASTTA